MGVKRLFVREDGGFVNIRKEQGMSGYAVVDATTTLRGKPGIMKKSIAKRFSELSQMIDATDEPISVKRTAKMVLKDFIEHEVKRVKRFYVIDPTTLVRTLIYYSRIINSLPVSRPPKIDKRVKRFLFSSDKYSGNLKRGIVNRRSVYLSLLSGIGVISDHVSDDVYAIATTLDKYVKPGVRHSPKTVAGAILYTLAVRNGWSRKEITGLFTAMKILKHNTVTFYRENRELVEEIISSMDEEDRKLVERKMREILEKTFPG